jgi:hypothetical protein
LSQFEAPAEENRPYGAANDDAAAAIRIFDRQLVEKAFHIKEWA